MKMPVMPTRDRRLGEPAGQASQCQPWCGHQGVGEQHAKKNYGDEEPLYDVRDGEILVRQITLTMLTLCARYHCALWAAR
jgi:hypothetical protein